MRLEVLMTKHALFVTAPVVIINAKGIATILKVGAKVSVEGSKHMVGMERKSSQHHIVTLRDSRGEVIGQLGIACQTLVACAVENHRINLRWPTHGNLSKRRPGCILISVGSHQLSFVEVLPNCCHSFVEDLRQRQASK